MSLTFNDDDDFVDGCAGVIASEEYTADDDVAAVVLFADADSNDAEAIERRRAEWAALFSGES